MISNIIKFIAIVSNQTWTTFGSIRTMLHQRSWKQQSYYTEFADRRKTEKQIFWEQLRYILKYSYPNTFYYLYGFDIKGWVNQNDYVDYLKVFRSVRDKNNKGDNSPFVILRDKFLFSLFCNSLNINTPPCLFLIDNNIVKMIDNNACHVIEDLPDLYPELDAFAKLINGECAKGVYKIQIVNSNILLDGTHKEIDYVRNEFRGKRFIVQQRISQHQNISAIFPNAVNTIRLVTVYDKKTKTVKPLSAVLRVGTGKNHVDNWAAGGLAIGIDLAKGCLLKYGFYKPAFGTKTTIHPDTGIEFDGYEIPFFKDAVSLALRCHDYLYGIHSIGWDIAITPDGPCIIEGNDNWEISLMQACNGGLLEQFKTLF